MYSSACLQELLSQFSMSSLQMLPVYQGAQQQNQADKSRQLRYAKISMHGSVPCRQLRDHDPHKTHPLWFNFPYTRHVHLL